MDVNIKKTQKTEFWRRDGKQSIFKNVRSTREILLGLLRNREENIFLGKGGEHARN